MTKYCIRLPVSVVWVCLLLWIGIISGNRLARARVLLKTDCCAGSQRLTVEVKETTIIV